MNSGILGHLLAGSREQRPIEPELRKALEQHNLDHDDVDGAVESLGRGMLVLANPNFDHGSQGPVGSHFYPVDQLLIGGTGKLVITSQHLDGSVLHIDNIKAVHESPAASLARLQANAEADKDVPWIFSVSDLRERYEAQKNAERKWRIQYLKNALLAYDPDAFKTMSDEGPSEELETGDLVRAKVGLHGVMAPAGAELAYVYQTDENHNWLSSWNKETNGSVEPADIVLAIIDDNGRLDFMAANSRRLMRVTEEEAIRYGNGYNLAWVNEIKKRRMPDFKAVKE
jgi:hypothetical protein